MTVLNTYILMRLKYRRNSAECETFFFSLELLPTVLRTKIHVNENLFKIFFLFNHVGTSQTQIFNNQLFSNIKIKNKKICIKYIENNLFIINLKNQ